MPSPFPGMDPFLEHPDIFPDLHDRFVTNFSDHLQVKLPEPYYASLADRLWVEFSRRPIGPDIDVISGARNGGGALGNGGGVAIAAPTRTMPVIVHVPHDECREPFVEIYCRRGHEQLITHIEVLSLANKTPGEHGRDLYRRKQKEILGGKVHLVEIDLLRGGVHTTAVPLDRTLEKTGPFDYHVCSHHYDNLEDYFVYPFGLKDRLPEIAVPLLPGDGAVTIDLQAVFDRCYETGPYRRRVRYGQDPIVPPLDAERSDWVATVLRG